MKLRRSLRERIRWCKSDRLPGQTLKRKKWVFALIVLICASFDVLLLFVTGRVISLFKDAPYLPKEYTQAYTHLATFRATDSHEKYGEVVDVIAFSPDGQLFAAGGRREVHLWDVRTGNLLSILKKEHREWIHVVAFSPDGKTLASVSSKGGRSHSDLVVLLNPLASRHLVLHTIRLLDAKTGTTRLTFSVNILPITALEFSSDGTKLLTVSEQGFTGIYDSATGHREKFSRSLFVHDAIRSTYRFKVLTFSSDGKILATGGLRSYDDRGLYDIANAEIQLWNADTGHLLHTFNSPGRRVNLLAFSPDGKTLASVGEGGDWWNKIFIWDLENRRLLSIINIGKRGITALRFAPDSIILASGHTDGTARLWDITGRK